MVDREQTVQPWRGTARVRRPDEKPLPRVETMAVAELILPWAKEKHPDKYADTIKRAGDAAAFRRFVLRLVEIRWETEPEWRREVPLNVLDETAITATVKAQDGTTLIVAGRAIKGEAPQLRWTDLTLSATDFALLVAGIVALDMEIVR